MEIEEINYMETLKVNYTEAAKGKNFLGDTTTACSYLKDIYVSKEKWIIEDGKNQLQLETAGWN